MIDRDYCISSCVAFRWVAKPEVYWDESWRPAYPQLNKSNQTAVKTAADVKAFLMDYLNKNIDDRTGILLSGGIDSAILASYLPPGTKAYTIRFVADGAIDESILAKRYAERYHLEHRVVDVTWEDYLEYMPALMRNKKSPLHAVEVGLYKAVLEARKDGITKLILGNGADSTFGGMDKLLSKDWTFDEFVARYTFIDPERVLVNPVPILDIYNNYKQEDNRIDYISFLKYTHGLGIVQAFENAITFAGCSLIEPFEHMYLSVPLDIIRIRQGEPKYILYEIFRERYEDFEAARKIPFARPMDQWLSDWMGPTRREFKKDCIKELSGDQKYIIYTLECFLNILEK